MRLVEHEFEDLAAILTKAFPKEEFSKFGSSSVLKVFELGGEGVGGEGGRGGGGGWWSWTNSKLRYKCSTSRAFEIELNFNLNLILLLTSSYLSSLEVVHVLAP